VGGGHKDEGGYFLFSVCDLAFLTEVALNFRLGFTTFCMEEMVEEGVLSCLGPYETRFVDNLAYIHNTKC